MSSIGQNILAVFDSNNFRRSIDGGIQDGSPATGQQRLSVRHPRRLG